MKSIATRFVSSLARAVLRRYAPVIVGVTGSVGKTSTKEAIFTVLQTKERVRRSIKSFNNELGVPLTIIGADAPGRSPARWIGIIFRACGLLLRHLPAYPNVLVLEYGADHPGDVAKLLKLAPCLIGVLTAVGHTHTEFFGSVENVLEEKAKLIRALPADGFAVLNADDERVLSLRGTTKARVITFGFHASANVHATQPTFAHGENGEVVGVECSFTYEGTVVPVTLHGILGRHQVYAPLAAAAVGLARGMNLIAIGKALAQFQPLPGRMRLLVGIKNTSIIDDTYNSSPMAAVAALDTLAKLPSTGKKIAVLGDMAELGEYSEEGHATVGEHCARLHLNMLVVVGAEAKQILRAAKSSGMSSEKTFAFDFAQEAAKFIQEKMEPHDAVLIKGSQRMRMERAVKELMAEPEQAKELLVRQDPRWLEKA